MHFGLAYNMQLQDVGPIAQQANQHVDVDNHNDAMFYDEDDASLPPPMVRDGEYDDIQSSDDEEDEEDDKAVSPYRDYDSADDEDFCEDDCSKVTADDMNLDHDLFVSESALPSIFNDITMLYDSKKHLIPPEESKPNARKQPLGHMNSQNIAMSQLLILVNKHGGSKELYDVLVEFILRWNKLDPEVFKVNPRLPAINRKSTLAVLEDEFQSADMKYVKHSVRLHDGRVVTIPVPDFAPQVRDLLDHPFIWDYISTGIDKTTFRPVVPTEIHENDPNAILGDKHTGHLYQRAIDLHCPSGPNVDETLIRPLLIILHIDKSHADLFGVLSLTPIQWSLAMITNDGQYNIKAWRVLAYIPNLSAGKGIDGKKSNDAALNRRDFHKCLSVAMSSVKQHYDAGGIWWKDPNGKDVLLKPIIHMSIGDTVGQNELVNHYNNYLANCLGKDCLCSQKDILTWPCQCRWPLWKEISECPNDAEVFSLYDRCGLVSYKDVAMARGDAEYAKTISKDPFETVWDFLPLSDRYLGMTGMTPQEFLHVGGSGLYKHALIAVREIVGPNQSNSLVKGLVNKVFVDVKLALERNSERDISRMSNRKGFFNHASLTSEEVRGNFFAMVILMHTTYGRSLFKECFDKKSIPFAQARTTCLLLLAWERFYLDPQKRKDVEASFQATQRLQKRMYKLLPREQKKKTDKVAGCRGWKISKFHVMVYMSGIMLKYGCLKGVDSGPNERHHKGFIKQHYKRTQKISSKFASQIAQGEYERQLLEKARLVIQKFVPEELRKLTEDSSYEHSQGTYERQLYDSQLDDDDNERYNTLAHELNVSDSLVGRGAYSLTISLDESRRRNVSHKWKYGAKNIGRFLPNSMVGKVLSDYHIKYCEQYCEPHRSTLNYECYTSLTYEGTIYKSEPNWKAKGCEWYDWCVVRFPSTKIPTNRTVHRSQREGTVGGMKSIARIMGFFRHVDKGVPTYINVESNDASWERISRSNVDTTMYMILHCQSDYFSYSTLQTKFVYKFSVTPVSEMFVLPVGCIVGPLLVINDILEAGRTSKNQFMAILPRHKQSKYFINYMYSTDPQYEVNIPIADAEETIDDEEAVGQGLHEDAFSEGDEDDDYGEDEDELASQHDVLPDDIEYG
jgi:hypothetical protein